MIDVYKRQSLNLVYFILNVLSIRQNILCHISSKLFYAIFLQIIILFYQLLKFI